MSDIEPTRVKGALAVEHYSPHNSPLISIIGMYFRGIEPSSYLLEDHRRR